MIGATYSYAPGGALAVCGPRVAALVDLPAEAGLVPGLYELVSSPEGTLDEVLELLVTPGLRAVQQFALAEPTDEGLRVLVRGGYRVEAGGQVIEGKGLWTDRIVAADRYCLVDPQSGEGRLALPLPAGVVLAGRVSRSFGSSIGPARPDVPAAPAAGTPQPVPAPIAAEDASVAPVAAPAVGAPFAATPSVASPFAPPTDAVGSPAGSPAAPTPDPSPDEGISTGHTLPTPFTSPIAGLPSPPAASSAPVPSDQPTFIDSLPWSFDDDLAPGAPTQVVPAGPSEPASDHTISRDSLPREAEQTVVAARCPAGHLSPAYAGTCRVCGRALPPQQPVEIPRPPLGVLRLSNGDVVLLDRGCILGRNPRLPTPHTGEQPNLVKLVDPDKDISGQHLEVRLEYWHVAVKDLGSTNGTQVVLPGENPVTLRPNDPMMIEPGTKVILAGVFSFTFEVTP
ncbi:FHA domain-containing protein [Micropruina sp.]|uniref:FHA domain-containing protein n=1 Tax=Micropruina sp. TaxID=2737536 RepID=UPI0039E319C0